MTKRPYLIFGTGNAHKGIEATELVAPTGVALRTLAEFPEAIDVVEDGETFAENARKKAVEQAKHLQTYVLAEDSGICVDFLNGEPGVRSARFAGENPRSDRRNNELLVEKLANVPLEKRTARYVCHMVLSDPTGAVEFEAEEYCRGRILLKPSGDNGFGYDPLFEVVEFHRTFGELAPEIKRAISHRARATRRLIPKLYELVAAGKLPTMEVAE